MKFMHTKLAAAIMAAGTVLSVPSTSFASSAEATISASGTITAGCGFESSTFTVNLGVLSGDWRTSKDVPATIRAGCANGVSARIYPGFSGAINVTDSIGNTYEVHLKNGSCSIYLINASSGITITGTGSMQDVPICVSIRKSGTTPDFTGGGTISFVAPIIMYFY